LFIPLVIFLCLLCLFKVENHTVDTIAKMGRGRAVIEHVTQMGFASSAHDLRTFHAIGIVGCIDYARLADGLIKAGPAAAALEFGIALKKRIAADGTIVSAHIM
jgi:hypothetical protein